MKTMKTKRFDAVAESRRWKEAVARQTEGLSREEVLAFFDKAGVLTALSRMRGLALPTAIAREEPPKP